MRVVWGMTKKGYSLLQERGAEHGRKQLLVPDPREGFLVDCKFRKTGKPSSGVGKRENLGRILRVEDCCDMGGSLDIRGWDSKLH